MGAYGRCSTPPDGGISGGSTSWSPRRHRNTQPRSPATTHFHVGRKLGAPVMERKKHVQLTMEYVSRKKDVIMPAMLSRFAMATPTRAMAAVRRRA